MDRREQDPVRGTERVREADEPKVYTAEQVSQGRIVLNTPLRRAIFFGGLALFVIVVIAFSLPARMDLKGVAGRPETSMALLVKLSGSSRGRSHRRASPSPR